MDSVSNNHIISATSQRGNTAQNDEYGLIIGNHYTVIGAYEIIINGEPIRLIKLRDSWSKSHYTGPWNYLDERWTTQLKANEKIAYTDQTDGAFFLDIDTFKLVFSDFTIAYLMEDWAVSLIEGTDDLQGNEKLEFEFELPQLKEMYLEIYTYPPRMFPPSCAIGYPRIVLELFHEDGTRKDFVDGFAEEGYLSMKVLDLDRKSVV